MLTIDTVSTAVSLVFLAIILTITTNVVVNKASTENFVFNCG